MKCPNCQFDIPDGSNFCNKCGSSLTSATSVLTALNEKIDKIQRYLPQGLTEKILDQKDKIEGERKQVTVLFCDLVGFTSMSEKLGPEDTYSIMDQVLEILIHKVHDYGGTVNQLLGDGLYALFGAPIAIEDASSRAIRSALDMLKGITEFRNKTIKEKNIPPLEMRIGINSGPVVVGTIGNSLRVEFKAVGDTVNLASRMEGLAEPGTVYLTEETYKQARLYFNFEALGEKTIKGKEKPVSVYKVISEKEKVHHRLTSDRIIQSEMVGRESEIDKLAIQVLKAKSGEGSIINIIGEAGIGKSRLIAELKIHDVVKNTTILEGRALSMGRNLSFYPIIEILKGFAGIGDGDSATEQLYKLEKAVKNIHPDHADEIIPFVASLMGIQLTGKYAERVKNIEGEALEKLIYKNLRDFVLKSAEVSPLILILEDLHWADTSSIDLITSLCRLVKNNRILIINIFRPYYEETSEKLKKAVVEEYLGFHTEINLHRLDKLQSDQLINNLLRIEGLPTDMRNQIKEKSEGNPFFIEEMARSMIDEGAIEIHDGKFSATKKIDTVVVPNTIQELLMSRIDRLDEKTKSLLRTASVIGRHFFHKILTEVVETVEDIDDQLGYLQEIQLIREGKRMEEVEYLFKHALAQETTYESILQEKRKELHLKVAESFERVFTERLSEFYGMLAYHFIKAENLVKAEGYMIKAGEEAIKSSASSEVLQYFQNAIKLYKDRFGKNIDPLKLADFEEKIAHALYSKGIFPEAVEYFDKTLAHLGRKQPSNNITVMIRTVFGFLALIKLLYFPATRKFQIPNKLDVRVSNIMHPKANALAMIDPRKFFFESIGVIKDIYRFNFTLYQDLFDFISGCSVLFSYTGISFKLSKRILDYTKDRSTSGEKLVSLAYHKVIEKSHNLLSGSRDSGLEESVVDELLSIGDSFSASTYLWCNFIQFNQEGSFTYAKKCLGHLKSISDKFHDDFSTMIHFIMLKIYYAKKVNLAKFFDDLDKTHKFIKNQGFELFESMFVSTIGPMFVIKNDLPEADNAIIQVAELFKKMGKERTIPSIIVQRLVGKLHFELYRLENSVYIEDETNIISYRERANKTAKEAIKACKKCCIYNSELFRFIAIYFWLNNKQKKALIWFDKSIKEGERLGARPDLSRTYMEVGKRLMEPKSKYKHLNSITAEEYLEKARVLFEEMDLQWDLEQLEKLKEAIR